MLKKIMKGVMTSALLMGLATSANAATYEINMYGASAQYTFWNALADDFLLDPAGGACTALAVKCETSDKKNGVAKGTSCLGAGHDIVIRYSSKASTDGIARLNDQANVSMANEEDPDSDGIACEDTKSVKVNLGASDVAYDRFSGQTHGWENGNKSYVSTGPNYHRGPFPNAAPPAFFKPIVVPFAFYANNSVCKFRCVKPTPYNTDGPVSATAYATAAHKSYSHWEWECDPTKSTAEGYNEECIGHYKCIGGVCNGGVNVGQTCTKNVQCPDVTVENTRCEAMPINNITHTMAGQIFSGQVSSWTDFGPYYCSGKIHKMMRHEGSGTHSTLRDLLKPYALSDTSNLHLVAAAGWASPRVIHFTSSSDLLKAVADFPGSIGYADADQALQNAYSDGAADGAWNPADNPDSKVGIHVLMFDGVEPVRKKIKHGEYEFWAAQYVYYNPAHWTGDMETVRTKLVSFSSNPDNINATTLGGMENFWAAQDEMLVDKQAVKYTKDQIIR